ncbi:hypothetical protein [Peribacillus sp. SCS-155]
MNKKVKWSIISVTAVSFFNFWRPGNAESTYYRKESQLIQGEIK